MSWTAALPVIGKLIERVFPDKEAQDRAKIELMNLEIQGELTKIAKQAEVVTAEAKSEHWITATWRPIMMLTFVAIIANNYILYPYLRLFWPEAPLLEVPVQMWDLLQIGVGGYIVGRSAEKAVKEYRKEYKKNG